MTGEDIKILLKSTNFPVAYHHFKEAQDRPYIVFALDGDADFMADNTHYVEIMTGYIELYTDKKDTQSETKVKNALNNNHIAFKKENEDYIDSEKVFYVRWSFSII